MAKSRILILVHYYLPGYKSGGPIRSIANLISAFGTDFDFKVVTADRDSLDTEPYPEILSEQWLQQPEGACYYISPRRLGIARMLGILKQQEAAILYLNSFFDARFSIVPILLHYFGLSGSSKVILAPRGEFSKGALVTGGRIKKRIYIKVARFLRLYKRVYFQASSPLEAEDIRKQLGRVTALVVAPDLPTIGSITAKSSQDLASNNRLQLCFLSRIHPKKNLDYALDLLRQIDTAGIDFSIYGPLEDASYWSYCQGLIEQLPTNICCTYKGQVTHDKVVSVLSRHDLLLLPTKGENFGHVILESLMAGTPVLISDQTPWQQLQSRRAGWELPLQQPEAFAEQIIEYSRLDTEQRLEMSAGAQNVARQYLDNEQLYLKSKELFIQVAGLPTADPAGWLRTLRLYWTSIGYLRPTQFLQLIRHRLASRIGGDTLDFSSEPSVKPSNQWLAMSLYEQKHFDDGTAVFINQKADIRPQQIWNDPARDKLWLYNLHYFEDLQSDNADTRMDSNQALIYRWIDENPLTADSIGWQPYPLSRRLVNWIKFYLEYPEAVSDKITASLQQQTTYLSRHLEYHLLANHLLANVKALVFAGCFFNGQQSQRWLQSGLKLLEQELKEQVLQDGGHYEASPMYHAIVVTDLLDLLNLFRAYEDKVPFHYRYSLEKKLPSMLNWLHCMLHPDAQIGFFNDSVFGISAPPERLFTYAHRLGLELPATINTPDLQVHDLWASGYISIKGPELTLLIDTAAINPPYQCGHSHADHLSFELSLGGHRLLVNSGISTYEVGVERSWQRGTCAHNSVVVDGLNSSEVWHSFRVARRARIIERRIEKRAGSLLCTAAQDGFVRQGVDCIHRRSWQLEKEALICRDKLEGSFVEATGYLHLHPQVSVRQQEQGIWLLAINKRQLALHIEGADSQLEPSCWYPEFGLAVPNNSISYCFKGSEVTIRLSLVSPSGAAETIADLQAII